MLVRSVIISDVYSQVYAFPLKQQLPQGPPDKLYEQIKKIELLGRSKRSSGDFEKGFHYAFHVSAIFCNVKGPRRKCEKISQWIFFVEASQNWVKQFFFISRTTPTGSKLVQTDFSRLTNKDCAIIRLLIANRKIPNTVGYFDTNYIKGNIVLPKKVTVKNVLPSATIFFFLVFIFNFFFRLLLTLSPVPKNRHRSSSCSLLCKCPCKTFGSLTISPQLRYPLSPPANKDFPHALDGLIDRNSYQQFFVV